MWKNSCDLALAPDLNLVAHTKLLKSLVLNARGLGLRAIYLVITSEARETRVAEYINMQWVLQATEHDVFT